MSRGRWKTLFRVIVGLVLLVVIAALGFAAWGDYRLWRARQDAGDYLSDLYPQTELGRGEVNGSDLLDAVAALTAVAVAESGGRLAGAEHRPSFAQAAELIRRHAAVQRVHHDARTPEDVAQISYVPDAPVAIRLLRKHAVAALEREETDEYLRLLNDQLALVEWTLLESPMILSQTVGLSYGARVLASVGAEAPLSLAQAPAGLRRRLHRLTAVEIAAAFRAERAYVLSRSPENTPGSILDKACGMPSLFLWAGVHADQAESVASLAKSLRDPPYLRSEPSDTTRTPWLFDSLVESASELEAHLLQLQIAAAASDYLQECLHQAVCPRAPTVRAGAQVVAVDPYTGESWRWLPQGEDCVLYSVGPDRGDDGGNLFAEGKISEPGIDIGWTLPCGETRPAFKDLAPTTAPDSLGSS